MLTGTIGQLKKEIQLTSAERMRKFRASAAKRELENKKQREKRMQKRKELSKEEKCLIR